MKIGAMRRRFDLLGRAPGKDAFGGISNAFTTISSFWGELRPASAFRTAQMAQLNHTISHVLEVRHRTDLVPGSKLASGDRSFEVVTVLDPDDRRRSLVLTLLEGKR